jgi:hypothetical protein
MLIRDLEYLEATDNTEAINGGFELLVAASTTNISGVYRGEGYVSGGVSGYASANLGSNYCYYYGCSNYQPSVYANSGGNIYAS